MAAHDAKDWRPSLMSAVVYRDPKAALKFLEAAFGFELEYEHFDFIEAHALAAVQIEQPARGGYE